MAARLAGAGYAVALPDLFWRAGPYAPIDPKLVFTEPAMRERHRATLMATATAANAKVMGWTPPDGIDVPEWRC